MPLIYKELKYSKLLSWKEGYVCIQSAEQTAVKTAAEKKNAEAVQKQKDILSAGPVLPPNT